MRMTFYSEEILEVFPTAKEFAKLPKTWTRELERDGSITLDRENLGATYQMYFDMLLNYKKSDKEQPKKDTEMLKKESTKAETPVEIEEETTEETESGSGSDFRERFAEAYHEAKAQGLSYKEMVPFFKKKKITPPRGGVSSITEKWLMGTVARLKNRGELKKKRKAKVVAHKKKNKTTTAVAKTLPTPTKVAVAKGQQPAPTPWVTAMLFDRTMAAETKVNLLITYWGLSAP